MAAEVERLTAERDAAVAALDEHGRRVRRRGRTRSAGVGVLIVVFALLVPITVTAAWAHRVVLNTDQYVSTVGPLASRPAVTAAVSRQITSQIYATLDPQQRIADSLPDRAAYLAGPIATGVRGYVQDAVNRVVSGDRFRQLWQEANRYAHGQLVAVLRGDTTVVQTTDGAVVLNLVPVLNSVLQEIQGFASSVVGRPITLPAITADELPSAACSRLAAALERPVPPTCGQIALFPADKLDQAQNAVRAFDRAVLALLIVTPLVFLLALWMSRRRRRTLLQLCLGGALAVVVVRRVLIWLQHDLVATGKPENEQARSAIVHGVLDGYFSLTGWILLGATLLVLLALVTGPYRWAAAGRRAGQRAGASVAAAFRGGAVTGQGAGAAAGGDQRSVAWIQAHLDEMRVAGVVVAVLLVLLLSMGRWGLIFLACLLVAYEWWLHRLRPAGADRAAAPPQRQP